MAERRDAARNRAAIRSAAARLIRERGPDGFVIEDVAAAAGVGKGTVFRHFTDRAGLVRAVVELASREWRTESDALFDDADMAPDEKLVTFVGRLFDHVVDSLPLVRALELSEFDQSGCDDNTVLVHRRISDLIAQVNPDADARYIAHALLALLRGDVLHHQLVRSGLDLGRVRAGVIALARSVLVGDLERAGRDATMPGLSKG
ncbi:TetR/AcrR family transcriptional regulator [Saccharothrix violaceirubra]|uniref:AcrR family transcriptional regulator n=1 Tax=Saccharothrix violaceirubra TaxID=413306 RepID=A0A7W7WUN5_9PSEU|nr:TetR/AcrR family transcriptional regulator [Saccharothrix violaceirubra]MBB4964007.1 AcrR family transcriptional regulator [Saccharothrix violaceirubra]